MTLKYQHRNVSVTKNTMSISLLFRVVNKCCNYDRYNNAMIPTTIFFSNNYLERDSILKYIYKTCDTKKYYEYMDQLYVEVLNPDNN